MMEHARIQRVADELYHALLARQPVAPLSARDEAISIEDAYRISQHVLERRLLAGASVIGKKIGITSEAVQQLLNVHQPDFGYLTDDMLFADGASIPISARSIAPRAEGEIAFVLRKDLIGPGVTNADVLAATDCVMPCFEIVDSRIRDWRIAIQDTIADNASCGFFVLGEQAVSPHQVDLANCRMVVEKNGSVLSTGTGAAALGSPLNCVAWLANTLGALGTPLRAGEIILSGSLVPLEPVRAGDAMRVTIDGIGSASVRFS